MRGLADADRIQRLMAGLGQASRSEGRIYFTGGATAVLASPADFIPVPAGWEDRSTFVQQSGRLAFLHFDLYAQAMAKVERGHHQDIADVQAMLNRGLIDRARARAYFDRIEPELFRFPAIHPPAFHRAVEEAFG